ncbi:MAG TPA: hypothetical protein VFA78_01865 [Chloroflexota bacterium]|nr:hypothetical protein [Chloroflexota bacterium]
MGKRALLSAGLLTTASLTGIHVSWVHFASNLYPYSVSQPSSFKHVVLQDAADHRIDYFYPALGSFTTNVNIWGQRDGTLQDEAREIEALGGRHVRRIGTLEVMGRHRQVIRGDFRGISGRWSIEQVDFRSKGWSWHLTASFDPRYKKMLPTLLHILRSFRIGS